MPTKEPKKRVSARKLHRNTAGEGCTLPGEGCELTKALASSFLGVDGPVFVVTEFWELRRFFRLKS